MYLLEFRALQQMYVIHTYYVGILLQRPSMYYNRSSGPKEPNEGAIRSGLPRRA